MSAAGAASVAAAPEPHASSHRLVVRELRKSYGENIVLHGISFEAAPGEIFGLLGPNGAGKTSCLECILGLRQPDAGTIELGGLDVTKNPIQAKRLFGALLQSASLQDVITAREALELFASFYENAAKVSDLVARFDLAAFEHHRFTALSGGQRQRVFLALAFVNQPRVVVLDEPSSGLDPLSRRELHRSIRAARDEGCTVILSTHYLEEAEQLCDRVAILDRGRIVATDTVDGLFRRTHAPTRIFLQLAPKVDAAQLLALAGVSAAAEESEGMALQTRDVVATLGAIVKLARASGTELRDLRVMRPTLEDVFLELTGRAYPENHDAGREG
ncbi:MAG TPA: ABC transporter ATP-binding protein [Opitutaceae bacterium]|nr:ABC transporter ATP-binding protein [Opitutaceae bacterium]